ncbi:hypothetical protein BWO90_02465 (plasmid) [Sinorhizobium meliloti]|nr:hypothetical protein BWO76_02525 [Sinorhizobium meliloti]ATB01054.1 hypothetical protein BWO90_02465 [Sinorhizobium meliloti]
MRIAIIHPMDKKRQSRHGSMEEKTEPARFVTINAPLRCPPILMRRTRTQSAGEETHGCFHSRGQTMRRIGESRVNLRKR